MNIHKRLVPVVFIALLVAACSPSNEAADTTSGPVGGSEPTVRLVTSDGLDETMIVTSCNNPGETTLTLKAQSNDLEDPIIMDVDATGGKGTIVLSGGDEREGTVDQLMVGDTGEITASGVLNIADDSDTSNNTFELTGNCA